MHIFTHNFSLPKAIKLHLQTMKVSLGQTILDRPGSQKPLKCYILQETLTKMESDFKTELMKRDEAIKEWHAKCEEAVGNEAKLRKEVQDKTKSKQQLR